MITDLILSAFGIMLTAVMGYAIWLLKEQKREKQIENQKRDANSQGTRLILFYMLQRLHTEYKHQGFVTYNQRRSFREIYDAYHALGGNGFGTAMWEEVNELEIKNEEVGLSTYAKSYLAEKEKITKDLRERM